MSESESTIIVNNEQKSSKRNHRCCSVPTCKSANFENLTFHVFPKEGTSKAVIDVSGEQVLMDRRKAWGVKTFLGKEFGKDVKDSTYVCSRHFLASDYRPQNLEDNSGKMKMRCLKKAAVPSQNLPLRAPSPVEKKKKKKKSKPKPKSNNSNPDSATPSTSSTSSSDQEVLASCSMSIPDMLDTCDTSMINDALLSSLLDSIPDLPNLTNLEHHSVETVIPVHRESRTLLEMLEAGEDIMEAQKSWGIDAGPIFDDHLNMS